MASNTARRARLERWFAVGAAAASVTFEGVPADAYVCPLCGRAFDRTALATGALTEEHVPPRHAGGEGLVLTCRECNSRAGSAIDRHAEVATAVAAFARVEPGRPVRVALHAEGVTQNVEADTRGGAWRFFGVAKANAPGVADQMIAINERWAAAGNGERPLGIEVRERFDARLVRLSWARAAYLVAIAHFGYRYAFNAALRPLVEQIAHPGTATIEPPVITVPPTQRALAHVTGPPEMRGIAVAFGERVVLLPESGDVVFFERWSRADAITRLSNGVTLNGRLVPWPTEPQHVLDRADL